MGKNCLDMVKFAYVKSVCSFKKKFNNLFIIESSFIHLK
jgi:hypothetical protein